VGTGFLNTLRRYSYIHKQVPSSPYLFMRHSNYTRTIKLTIYTGFGLSTSLLLFLVYLNLSNISLSKEKLHELVYINNPIIALLHELEFSTKERTLALFRLIDEKDPFILDEGLMLHQNLASRFIKTKEEIEPLLQRPDEQILLKNILKKISDIQPLHIALVDALQNDKRALIPELKLRLFTRQQDLYKEFESFINHIENHNQEFAAELNDSAERTYQYDIVISIIAFLAFFTIVLLVSRYVFSKTAALDINKLELENARIAADEANNAKSLFIANMSHEIRTPLTAIRGSIALIQKESMSQQNETLKNMISIAHRNTERLLVLLNDVLDFSRIETGNIEYEFSHFDVVRETREILDLFSPQVQEKGISLNAKFRHKTIFVDLDQNRVRQILINLLGNAIKFTDQGYVTIKLETAIEDETDYLETSIIDSGIGIPADKLKQIFNSFTQADASTTRRFGGTGLGLSITKHLVEGMGGQIFVESTDAGSTFRVRLPMKEKSAPSRAPESD